MDKPILAYTGPAEAAGEVERVAGRWFDIARLAAEPSAVGAGLRGAAALLDASMRVRITQEMLDASPALRLVACATTGADHIDQQALAARGIPLWTLKGQTALLRALTPAAEHSWLLLMACARRLRAAEAHARAGQWDRAQFPGIMLRGRVLGIIGCGRIGGWMARYAAAFGVACQGYDPHATVWPEGVRRASLEELVRTSDFVTVHVPLCDETQGLLSRALLAQIKPGAIVINTSRGEVLDEAALLEGLQGGRIAAAGLDVLAGEPDVAGHPLRQYALAHDNVILTPHIGGYSPDAVRTVVAFSAERILQFFGFGGG